MNKYKSVSLYDSSRKMFTSRTFSTEGLNEKQIEERVKRIKEENKLKNKEFKEGKKDRVVQKIDKMINKETIKVSSDIELVLNKNTGNTIFLLGSSQRGKTTAMMELFKKYYSGNDFITILYAINYQIKHYAKQKNLIICKTFNKQAEKLIKMQKYINSNCNNKYMFCDMFDDIVDQKFNKLLNSLILTYRNSNISSLISLQYPKLLNRSQRANIHNVLLFGFNNDEAIVDVIKYWLRGFFTKLGYETELEQVELYKKMTHDHGFIYVSSLHNHISFHRLSL